MDVTIIYTQDASEGLTDKELLKYGALFVSEGNNVNIIKISAPVALSGFKKFTITEWQLNSTVHYELAREFYYFQHIKSFFRSTWNLFTGVPSNTSTNEHVVIFVDNSKSSNEVFNGIVANTTAQKNSFIVRVQYDSSISKLLTNVTENNDITSVYLASDTALVTVGRQLLDHSLECEFACYFLL